MDAVTAEQEAVCAALRAKIEDLESKILQSENTLSPDTGPLLSEEENGASRSHKKNQKRENRRELLREGATITNIRDSFL
ncbi:MAG: hypothetical protein K8R36_21150 [Planctomycetales bacterium]|nr:hypothetical protein [Planctomycetales bacterium]